MGLAGGAGGGRWKRTVSRQVRSSGNLCTACRSEGTRGFTCACCLLGTPKSEINRLMAESGLLSSGESYVLLCNSCLQI